MTDIERTREATRGQAPDNPKIISDLSTEAATALNPRLELDPEMRELAEAVRERQRVINIIYITPGGTYEQGQIVVDKSIGQQVQSIFQELLERKFPIASMKPLTEYDWNDDLSMEANNSSAHIARMVGGTKKLSLHSFGIAIDINPAQNPMVIQGRLILPMANRTSARPVPLQKILWSYSLGTTSSGVETGKS